MEQRKVGMAAGMAPLWRRVMPVILSALLLWFGVFIAGPWFPAPAKVTARFVAARRAGVFSLMSM
jgi:hypothetical protein